MHSFEHVDATSAEQAIQLLAGVPEARPLAGGTDLISEMRLGIRSPGRLVNLKTIPGLDQVTIEGGRTRIGALVRIADLVEHPGIRSHFPALVEAIDLAASPQIRGQATLGGNICQESRCWYFRGQFHCWLKGGTECDAVPGDNRHHAILGGGPCYTVQPSDPANALVAYDARVRWRTPKGERSAKLEKFFVRPTTDHRALVALEPSDLLTEIELELPGSNERSIFLKAMDRAAFGFALASVACRIVWKGDTVRLARIVLGGVAPVPWRAVDAEGVLQGKKLDEPSIAAAGVATTRGAAPLSHNAYKVRLVQGLVKQALRALM